MKRTTIALIFSALVAMIALVPTLASAGSQMSGSWHAKNSGGNLAVRVTSGQAQMKLSGSCSKQWLNVEPADAFVLEGGKLVLKRNRFKVRIGGECTTANVTAKEKNGGIHFSFRNKWKFSGSVQ